LTSQHLALNTALIDSNTLADNIPSTYLCIINSKIAGMANRELYNQMLELGYPSVGFAQGLATSLFMGEIVWNNLSSPRNLSPFIVFEQDPLSTTQTAQCLHLHLLSKNTKGKSLDKIKKSRNVEVKVPITFKELLQTLLFYSDITTVLFGPNCALMLSVRGTIFSICREKIIFKTRIKAGSNFPTYFLYAIEIHTQCWLGDCMRCED
jgi:hypothetical protein